MVKRIIITETADIRKAVAGVLEDARSSVLLTVEKEFDIKLSLNELLSNSIKYSDCSHTVMEYDLSDDCFCCRIMDNGKGFCVEEIGCAELYGESGRGVYLVRSVTEELIYNKEGNSVFFRIRLR